MKWTGHLLRLDENTPAKRTLREIMKPQKIKRGRQPLTWHKLITQDIKKANLFNEGDHCNDVPTVFSKLESLSKDRKLYRQRVVDCVMP